MVWPELAGIGGAPPRRAKQASERSRPGCDQADDDLCRRDRPDPCLGEQLGRESLDQGGDLPLERPLFGGQQLDPPGE